MSSFAPELETRRPAAVARVAVRNQAALYDAGSTQRRLARWQPPTVSPNQAVLPHLETLRARSRQATRNNGYAKGIIDKLTHNLVGWGMKPMAQADDRALREAIQDAWNEWTAQSDADGLLDFYGQETQAVRGWLEGGEAFIRLRNRRAEDGLRVPLQLQVLEPELVPHTHNVTLPSGNKVRAGIEFNALGQRVAYWFHPSRPGDELEWDTGRMARVPAESVIHLYDPLRAGQVRGTPHLTQALLKLRDLELFDDATLMRQQLSNMFAAFVTSPQRTDLSADLDPVTGQPSEDTHLDKPTLSLEPGTFQSLEPGEEITFSDPPDVGGGYKDFMRQQLFAIGAASGVPYEVLTGDMSGLNDRVMRVILHEFRRRLQAWQFQIIGHMLCRRVWRAWLDRGWLSGTLPLPADYILNPAPYARVSWTPQAWPYLHPVQDIQAQKEAVRNGFTSRSAIVSEQGEDADRIDLMQAEDNARADQLGLRYDSDGRAQASAAPAPSDGPPAGESQPNPDEVHA